MLDHPRIFVAANFIVMFLACSVFGIVGSIAVSNAFMLFIVAYNWKKSSINSVVMAILYSLLFDSQLYSFTSLNLRVWYALLLLLYIGLIVKMVRGRRRATFSFRLFAANLPVVLLFGLSIAWLILDNVDGKASIVKYWIFAVGLLYVLFYYFKKVERADFKKFLDYLFSLAVFTCFWGIFEVVMNLRGLGQKYMYDFGSVSPSGFFSETTWYAIFLLIGLVIMFLRYRLYGKQELVLFLPVFFAGILLSANRNTFVAVAVLLVLNLIFVFVGGVVAYKDTFRNRYMLLSLLIGLVILAAGWSIISRYIGLVLLKFNLSSDASSVGRVLALQNSMREITQSPFIGNGFAWYPDQVTSTGTYTGAKSFNLVLMIEYIFGLLGAIPFCLMIVRFLIHRVMLYIKRRDILQKYSFLIIAVFISVSMFTPFHQQATGMFTVALGAALGSADARWGAFGIIARQTGKNARKRALARFLSPSKASDTGI